MPLITFGITVPDLSQVTSELTRLFPTTASRSDIAAAAMRKAVEPIYQALRRTTPVGPTGNLRDAVGRKVVRYPQSGTAVGVVGYRRAAKDQAESAGGGSVQSTVGRKGDRGRHQWWIEFGTQERETKKPPATTEFYRADHQRTLADGRVVDVRGHAVRGGQGAVIASSFNKLGPFQIEKSPDGKVRTTPGYPKAFFKKGKRGQGAITIPAMQPGGLGDPPLRAAWNESISTAQAILETELVGAVQEAWSAISAVGSAD
jgi:hypothetical protein